jgi:hypothetical protein
MLGDVWVKVIHQHPLGRFGLPAFSRYYSAPGGANHPAVI